MRKKAIVVFVVTFTFVFTALASAAIMANLYVKGQKTGPVYGGVTQKGREGSIGVIAFDQESRIATDAATGMTTGRLRSGQITITKEIDKSSPVLRTMLLNNELIPDATIKFWAPNVGGAAGGGGTEVQNYTVKLTSARIVSIKTVMPNVRIPDQVKLETYEQVSFTYEGAEWIWTGGPTALEKSARP
jgi:type VI secretion system secreted protein Hcp